MDDENEDDDVAAAAADGDDAIRGRATAVDGVEWCVVAFGVAKWQVRPAQFHREVMRRRGAGVGNEKITGQA